MYNIEFYLTSEIGNLKDIWLDLEKGKDMTYFQSYDWYKFIIQYQPLNNSYFEGIISVVKKEEAVLLIAPLWVIKKRYKFINKKSCYFLGRNGWSDYLNVIYKQFDVEAFNYLLNSVSHKYGINEFYFEQIKGNSNFYNYLLNNKAKILNTTNCVELNLSKLTFEEYISNLTKNTKQNIRTAYNRARKDGLNIILNFDDKEIDKELCESIRSYRVAKKNIEHNLLNIIKNKIYKILSISYPKYLPFYNTSRSSIMSIYDGDNLMAFFNYGIDIHHRTIVVMAVGTNEQYERYSPGILLMYNFIDYIIKNKMYTVLDFTRGNEKYKYSLGGKDHFIYNFRLMVEND